MDGLLSPVAGGRVQLEGPEEVGGVLEVRPHREDLNLAYKRPFTEPKKRT